MPRPRQHYLGFSGVPDVAAFLKQCPDCRQMLHVSKFPRINKTKRGAVCAECKRAQANQS